MFTIDIVLVFWIEASLSKNHVQISSKFVPKKIIPYDDFEQVILVFRPEWVVQSQHMERFF